MSRRTSTARRLDLRATRQRAGRRRRHSSATTPAASDFTLARQGGIDVDVNAPLVFAGYGIDAPEYGYNDYAGIDVAGKVVMVLAREPQAGDPQEQFMGAWDTYHAYPAWKPEVARQQGAVGDPHRPGTAAAAAAEVASGPTNGQVRTDRPNHSLTSPFWDLPVFNIAGPRRRRPAGRIGQDDRQLAGRDRQERHAADRFAVAGVTVADAPRRDASGAERPDTQRASASSKARIPSSRTSTSS